MDSKFLGGLAVGIGILVGAGWLGSEIGQGIESFKDKDRVVTVKGLAEKEVNANHVIWPLAFAEYGDNLNAVYEAIEKKQALVIDFLKKGGISQEEISFAAPQVVDTASQTYGGNNRPNYRWSITQILTVSSEKVDQVRKLIQEQRNLIKEGVALTQQYEYMLRYSFTKLNEIKPGMIESATINAREAAEKFAKDSGSSLGKIRSANQGVFSITDRDETSPFVKNVRVVTTIQYYLKD